MRVLSLFDGYSGALQALKDLGIKVDKYYASEIDKHAIQVANKNHPEIIQLGDVHDINKEMVGEIACRENEQALLKLEEALSWLQKRTADRQARGVEGTNKQ